MSLFSRIPSPSEFSTDDDIADSLAGSQEPWAASLLSKNRSVLSDYNPDLSPVSGSATIDGTASRLPGSTSLLLRPGPTAAGSYQHSRHARTPLNDPRSPSIISISSDGHETPGTELILLRAELTTLRAELTTLRAELTVSRADNMKLKVKYGQLQGRNAGVE